MRDAVQAIVIPSSDVLSEQLQAPVYRVGRNIIKKIVNDMMSYGQRNVVSFMFIEASFRFRWFEAANHYTLFMT